MEQFIGTKIIRARPMLLGDYNNHRGWGIPEDEDPMREGYNVRYSDDYQSWSPKEVFEKAYRRTNDMNFGLAIEAMKMGKRVARRGWNGKDMFLRIQAPDKNSFMSLPYIYMRPVGGGLVPWLASQTDMLSDDWFIVE